MMRARGFPVALQVLLWAVGASLAGAVIGLAVGVFSEEPLEAPVVLISVLFGNVVGLTVMVASLLLFPRVRALGPWSGGALLVLALASGSVAGTVIVAFAFPLYILRDIELAVAVAAINAVLALIVGSVVYVYEGLRLRLAESLREVEEVRLVEARLKEAAARAELAALQARINPHFFFNTLNTISSLLEEDPERADEVVQTLADLFRYTLKAADAAPVPLGEELDFVRGYLSIEQARFDERLRVRWNVQPAVEQVPVPGLILQPLVENAVSHGIAPRSGGGTVTLSASLDGDALTLEVEDDGVGMVDSPPAGDDGAHGLGNVRRRLSAFYGERGRLELGRGADGRGTRARVTLPVAAETTDRGSARAAAGGESN